MNEYSVTIGMSEETVGDLLRSGNALQVFRVVQSSDKAGRPLLWRRQQEYSLRTLVHWSGELSAYTARDPIEDGREIRAGFHARVEVGDVLHVKAGGIGDVTTNGDPRAISVQNTTGTYFTCGIGGVMTGGAAAFCAFPLYGNNRQVIRPVEKVALRFSTQEIMPGTVLGDRVRASRTSFGPVILIDLTAKPDREVSYDINKGWSWGGFTWASQIPVGKDLVPLLIEPRSS